MTEIIQLTEKELFAAYRMPRSTDFHLIIDEQVDHASIEFVIHPFDKYGETPAVVIKTSELIQNRIFRFEAEQDLNISPTSREDYFNLAKDVIDRLRNTTLEKVVLSRIHIVDATGIDLYRLFQDLTVTYPNAFIYFYNIPGEGTWMGATPEILMERKQDIITTVALAATQKADNRSVDDVVWNEKEIEEQAIIQRYIEDHLNESGHSFQKGSTYTSQAGNVFHIKTVYDIPKMHSTDELVDQLHPGPAICGMPKADAMQCIIHGESHERKYYCGYLGLKTAEHTSLFINLRCMQVFKDHFALYVGGGLTADSIIDSEWEETTTKSKTLESVIQKSYIYSHDDE